MAAADVAAAVAAASHWLELELEHMSPIFTFPQKIRNNYYL